MTRTTDPIALTNRQWHPHSHVKQPMRHQARQQMFWSKIHPSDDLVSLGRRINSTRWCVVIALAAVLVFAGQFAFHAASDASASGSTALSFDAGSAHSGGSR